jgi:hypothetical protein
VRVRFLADADLNRDIVDGVRLREPAIDFKTADDAALKGLSDFEVLELTGAEERVLVSHDTSTMAVHFVARSNGLKEPRRLARPSRPFCERCD